MISVRYTTKIEPKLPIKTSFSTAALTLAKLFTLSLEEDLLSVSLDEKSMNLIAQKVMKMDYVELTDLTLVQAKTSISVVLIAYVLSKVLEKEGLDTDTIATYTSWPYELNDFSKKVCISEVLSAIIEYGNAMISMPVLRILQKSYKRMKKQKASVISDKLIIEFLLAYYASFDERFQAVFYPSAYKSLSSRDGALFEVSSMLSQGAHSTKIYSMSATSAWMYMMIQEPIPSLLQDFKTKSHRSTKITRDEAEIEAHPLEEEAYSLQEVCKVHMEEFLPVKADIDALSSLETLELIVADSVYPEAPAGIDKFVAHMLSNVNKEEQELLEWLTYCTRVKESVYEKTLHNIDNYPLIVTLDGSARSFILEASKDKTCNHRELIASSAFVAYLDEVLQGGAPDTIDLSAEDLQNGALALGIHTDGFIKKKKTNTKNSSTCKLPLIEKFGTISVPSKAKENEQSLMWNKYKTDCVSYNLPKIDNDEMEILKKTRRLANYHIPNVFQRLLLANMIADNRAIISLEDIIAIHNPEGILEATVILANTINPFVVHAGITEEASMLLAFTEILTRRALMTLPMSDDSANRIYSNIGLCALSSYQGTDGPICGEIENWKISMSQRSFDPRVEVAYIHEGPKELMVVASFQSSLVPASQQVSSGSKRRYKSTVNMPPDEILETYTHDMVAEAKAGNIGMEIIGRDEEIALIETILSRKDKSNPLLLAPAGAGKTALVEAIAKRIADNTTSLPEGMSLRSFDLVALTADGCSSGQMADRLERICNAAADAGVILFIDEIHMINSVGSGDFNAANILKPCLARNGLHIIGATTEREYNYSISRDKALARRFSAMHLHSLEFSDIVRILERKADIYGAFHSVAYQEGTASLIALLAQDYMSDRESPDRELDVLDTAASVAAGTDDKTVTEEHIVKAVKMLTSNKGVKTRHEVAKDLIAGEKSDEELNELFPNVAGQMKAKAAIIKRINETKLDISVREKPKAIMMFVGESGVGKTYMSQQMLPLIDAAEDDLLELYLTEYQDGASVTRLVGASPQYVGYNEGGVLTNFVKSHPGGIVVLNEIDKAHGDIQQLFLGVFDSGILRAGDGSVADCKSITFICTANTGFGAGKKNTLGFSTTTETDESRQKDIIETLKTEFGEPLIGRLDDVIVFDELSVDDMVEMCKINYRKLREKMDNRYGVDIADVYSIETLENEALEYFGALSQKELDARTGWKKFEDKIKPMAISLMK